MRKLGRRQPLEDKSPARRGPSLDAAKDGSAPTNGKTLKPISFADSAVSEVVDSYENKLEEQAVVKKLALGVIELWCLAQIVARRRPPLPACQARGSASWLGRMHAPYQILIPDKYISRSPASLCFIAQTTPAITASLFSSPKSVANKRQAPESLVCPCIITIVGFHCRSTPRDPALSTAAPRARLHLQVRPRARSPRSLPVLPLLDCCTQQ